MTLIRKIAFATLMACSATALAAPTMIDGEIGKVDKDAAKLTIRHGALTNLDMPPMTMVFEVSDKAMLGRVAASDKVCFAAEQVGGTLTVTAIEAIK